MEFVACGSNLLQPNVRYANTALLGRAVKLVDACYIINMMASFPAFILENQLCDYIRPSF